VNTVIVVRHFISRKATAIGSNSVNKFERAAGYRRLPGPAKLADCQRWRLL